MCQRGSISIYDLRDRILQDMEDVEVIEVPLGIECQLEDMSPFTSDLLQIMKGKDADRNI